MVNIAQNFSNSDQKSRNRRKNSSLAECGTIADCEKSSEEYLWFHNQSSVLFLCRGISPFITPSFGFQFAGVPREHVRIIADSIKNGKILVRNSNTQVHIMQSKHAWDKLIKMSGNIEEDCKKVVKLLEDNQIFSEKYRINFRTFDKSIRYEHEMKIDGHRVKAIFNKNLETGDLFLNDTWVVTK